MQRILLLTDLSASAEHAAAYAISCFGQRDVHYALVHAYIGAGASEPMVQQFLPELLDSAQNALQDAAARLQERTGVAALEHHLLLGPLPRALHGYLKEHPAHAVVMGRSGSHGALFFGSNTTAVVRNCPAAVLVVPGHAALRPVQRILLADDHAEVSQRDLALVRHIALLHDAEVVVAHVPVTVEEGAEHWSNAIYENGLAGVPLRFIEAHGHDVADALLRSTDRQRADLIAVLHRHTGVLGRLFHPSLAKELAVEGEHPLLVLEQR